MTEMVYGGASIMAGEPVLPRWWRTIDRWTLCCVLILFGIGLLLGLAASPPLAARNDLPAFYYVQRQIFFGSLALCAMVGVSMLRPETVRRVGVLGFIAVFLSVMLLPVLGTDFGKGATRWYSLGFASVQPSEFLKPFFVIITAWLMAASSEINAPHGKAISLSLLVVVVGFLVMQPDFGQSALVLLSWGVIYFVAGAPIFCLARLWGLLFYQGRWPIRRHSILPAELMAFCRLI